MKRIELLKILTFVILILPTAFILSACGNDESLKTFENITFINQTIEQVLKNLIISCTLL